MIKSENVWDFLEKNTNGPFDFLIEQLNGFMTDVFGLAFSLAISYLFFKKICRILLKKCRF